MSKYDEIRAEAKAEMADVYKGIELDSGSKYAFESGYFSGRLSVALEENDRLKKVIEEFKRK